MIIPRTTRILVVEPDAVVREALAHTARSIAFVDAVGTFDDAVQCIRSASYELLVTNVRLNAYNGLHLVYLLQESGAVTRAIAYGDETDIGLATDAQRAGAFFERASHLAVTLAHYIAAALPPADRRSPAQFDRRLYPRGGRRAWDAHLLATGPV